MARGAEAIGKRARVLVALPNRLSCQLLSNALKRSRYPLRVVVDAVSSGEVLAALREHQPHVAVISANLQDGPWTGFKVLRELRAAHPQIRVIILLDSPERDLVVDAFRAGASGVLCRAETVEVLSKCIHSVYKGQVWANSNELQFLLDALAQAAPLRPVDGKGSILLTQRQEEVVRLVAEGLTNREVSRKLGLSEHTVKNYLFRIYEKLGVSSRVELILYVLNQRNSAVPTSHENTP